MEHQDKNRIFIPGDKSSVPPDLSPLKEKDRIDQEKMIEAEKKQEEAFHLKRLELLKQYDAFVADTSVIEQIEKHGIDWGVPGFIIHCFVADFSASSKILLDDDLFRKFTPYAKIISASPLNKNTEESNKGDWKPGDIVHISDGLSNVQINPNWEAYQRASLSGGGKLQGKEPPKYIRKIYSWLVNGKLYVPDKARYILTNKYALLNEDSLRQYPGPYVFEVDQYEAGTKRISGNPWA